MSKSKPWEINWEITKPLDPSGQGKTAIGRNRTSGKEAIIKILKNQKSEQARRRIFREVSNLKVLYDAGCKVPKVFENNVDQFENVKIPLYFVMEKISGKTLLESVKEKKGLPFDDAIDLTIDLANSFKIALNEDVLHRDIKPENIIVRSLKKHDAVIVDYGLSFNKDIDSDLTQLDETLDNKFLSLPERRVQGGDRRDRRSDLTGICGIFFFCLTNEPPIDLSDEKGNPPHRRLEKKLREIINSEIGYSNVEAFFDQGFSTIIDSRYQTIEEVITRLNEIKNPGIKFTKESLEEFANKTKELMLKYDRKTQLEKFRGYAGSIINLLPKFINEINSKITPFTVSTESLPAGLSKELGGEKLNTRLSIIIKEAHYEHNIQINYEIIAEGQQCVVYRAITRKNIVNPNKYIIRENWIPIHRFDGLKVPDAQFIKVDFDANILEAMKLISREILQSND